MVLTYFKRFRMEIDLGGDRFGVAPLPASYELLPWHESLLESHAEAKYRSFRSEIDANVFPCLGEREGCRRLMAEISAKEGFVPQATWLMVFHPRGAALPEYCGTIQGVRDHGEIGAVQNLGVAPEHRGLGLGSILMRHALDGFHAAGLTRVYLEVTAQNTGAIRLYQRMGFRKVRTVYKASDLVLS
jgi:ribosomal protein S18 acetylase RimI-like enzyme